MARVLKPRGRLILGELGRYSVWAAERRVRGWLGAATWRRAQFWSRTDLEALARKAGLRVIDVRGSVFFVPNGLAARLVAPFEPLLTRLRAPGAAFLALAADKALALSCIQKAGEKALASKKVAAPWDPTPQPLGVQFLHMVGHLSTHKAQLFYYLKLQGLPVHTGHLWGM